MSVWAADIPVVSSLSSPAGIPLSAALPVMAVAILSMWAAHCTLEASPVHESAPEASPVQEFAPEASPVHESASEASPVHVFTPVPPEVDGFCCRTSRGGGALTHFIPWVNSLVCPVTATEALPAPPWLPAPPVPLAWPSIPPPGPPPVLHPPGRFVLFGVGVTLASEPP